MMMKMAGRRKAETGEKKKRRKANEEWPCFMSYNHTKYNNNK